MAILQNQDVMPHYHVAVTTMIILPNLGFGQIFKRTERSVAIDDEDDVVTGFYENYTGWDEQLQAPRFSCLFLFVGRLEGSKAEIATLDTRGTIELLEEDKIKLSLEGEPGGCWNVEPDFDESGVDFELTERKDWKFIRMVSSERAYFYDSPDESEQGKSYIIEGDILKVFEVEGDWVKGEYFGSQGITTGWIKESDLEVGFY